jgi:hypothetical protein
MHGDTCLFGDTNKTSSLIINLYCDDDYDKSPDVAFEGYLDDECAFIVKVKSVEACYKFSMNPLMDWIHEGAYAWGAVFIALGIVVGYFGRRLFKPTICMVGTLSSVFFMSLVVFSIFFSRNTEEWVQWLTFSVLLIVGCFVGLILAKLSKIGVAIMAGAGGFVLGMILYSAVLYKLDEHNSVMFWVITVILCAGSGILSFFFFDHIIIISTSLIGSYGLIRGVSMYAGGFPDEIDLI